MCHAGDDRYVEMSVPADRDMMIVVRLAASGVLARCGLTLDELGDLKMAVEEACSCLISQTSAKGRLDICFTLGEKDMRFECRPAQGAADAPLSDTEIEVVKTILESLVDSAEIAHSAGIIDRICLTVSRPL